MGNTTIQQSNDLFGSSFTQFLCLGSTEEGSRRCQFGSVHFVIAGKCTGIILLGKKNISFKLTVYRQILNSYRTTHIRQSLIICPILISGFRFTQLIVVYQLGYVIINIILFLCNLQGMLQIGSCFIHIFTCKHIVPCTAKIAIRTVRESFDKIIKGNGISLRSSLRRSDKQVNQSLIFIFRQAFLYTDCIQRGVAQCKSIDIL